MTAGSESTFLDIPKSTTPASSPPFGFRTVPIAVGRGHEFSKRSVHKLVGAPSTSNLIDEISEGTDTRCDGCSHKRGKSKPGRRRKTAGNHPVHNLSRCRIQKRRGRYFVHVSLHQSDT